MRTARRPGTNQQRVTMADVAARVGVSRFAVSKALRNHPGISVQRREEIHRTARELGFVMDPFLSALAAHRRQQAPAKSHGALAWINHWTDPEQLRRFKEFDLYWEGASEAAGEYGYRLDDIRWEQDCSAERLEKILRARGIEGVLIPPHRELIDWDGFDWSKFSVVRFGLSVPQPDANVVTSDGYRATVMAARKIHEYGYRRIGFVVNGEFDQRVGGNWSSGFYYAQQLLGMKTKLPPLLTFLKTRTTEELVRQKAVLEVWLKEHRPDALLISDREVPGMLRELGYRVPQDIALAGVTVWDIPGVDSGIDQHSMAIGRTAVETLLKQLNVNERGEPRDPVRILIEGRWQDGKSLPPLGGRKISVSARSEPRPLPSVPARKRVTLKEIADQIGVSKNTVSLALRGNPRISLATKEKIDATARELGYVADPILQRLAAYRRGDTSIKLRGVIAWLNHWNEPKQLRHYHEFENYWRGARLAARRLGYHLVEFIWPSPCPAQRAEQLLREREVLGLLIPPHKPDLDWGDFDWSQFSLVRFGMSVHQVDSNLVTADQQRAILSAVRRIQEYGYERIGLIYDANHDRSMGGNFFGGFTCAMNQTPLKPAIPALDFNVQQLDESHGARMLKEWMQAHRPQAVITTAPQVPVLLRKLGYRIPRDVAVAGTSVQDISVDAGIDQRSHAIGQIAAEMLIKQISLNERGEPADPCRILVESRWRDGNSLPSR